MSACGPDVCREVVNTHLIRWERGCARLRFGAEKLKLQGFRYFRFAAGGWNGLESWIMRGSGVKELMGSGPSILTSRMLRRERRKKA